MRGIETRRVRVRVRVEIVVVRKEREISWGSIYGIRRSVI